MAWQTVVHADDAARRPCCASFRAGLGGGTVSDASYMRLFIPGLSEDPAMRALLELKKIMNLEFLTRQTREDDVRVGNSPLILSQL